jgi:hypothetical protein
MGEASALVVLGVDEDLGFSRKATEGCSMQDSIPVTLKAGPPLIGLFLNGAIARPSSMGCSGAQ